LRILVHVRIGAEKPCDDNGFAVVSEKVFIHPFYASTTHHSYDICLIKTPPLLLAAAEKGLCRGGNDDTID